MGEPLDERKPSTGGLRLGLLETPIAGGAFSCGETALDDFRVKGQAAEFQREGLGRTHLAWRGEAVVGYFTLSVAELRIEYLMAWPPAARLAAKGMEAVPAVKVGRLAVDRRFQGQGIGAALLREVAALAAAADRSMAIGLLVVQAKPQSLGFYARLGFQLATATRRERGRKNRTMFVDLRGLGLVAKP